MEGEGSGGEGSELGGRRRGVLGGLGGGCEGGERRRRRIRVGDGIRVVVVVCRLMRRSFRS